MDSSNPPSHTNKNRSSNEEIVKALVCKGIVLERYDKYAEEIAVYDEIIRRFGNDNSPFVREQVAEALVNKGLNLQRQDKYEEAIALYGSIVRRFGNDPSPGIRKQVIRALNSKGGVLSGGNKIEDAIAIYDEIVKCFGEDDTPGAREQVAEALCNKGMVLANQQGEFEEAIALFDEIIRRFGNDDSPGVREQVAQARYNKSDALAQQGKPDKNWEANLEAIVTAEDPIAQYFEYLGSFDSDDSTGEWKSVPELLNNKGTILNEEAIALYDEIDRRFGNIDPPDVRSQAALKLFNKSSALERRGKLEETLAVYDELDRRFGNDDLPYIRGLVALSLRYKGGILVKQGKVEEGIAVYDEIVRRFGNDDSPKEYPFVDYTSREVRGEVADALFDKRDILKKQGKVEEEIAVLYDIARRFCNDNVPWLREKAAEAQRLREELLQR